MTNLVPGVLGASLGKLIQDSQGARSKAQLVGKMLGGAKRALLAVIVCCAILTTWTLCLSRIGLAQMSGEHGPFLWEVQGPNSPTYLAGTIHYGISVAELPQIVREKFEGSATFAMEADEENVDTEQFLSQFPHLLILPTDQSLDVMLGPEAWRILVERLRAHFPERVLKRLRPWIVSLLLDGKSGENESNTNVKRMDKEFLEAAKSSGKRLDYLENPVDAIKAMEKSYTTDILSNRLLHSQNKKAQRQRLHALFKAYLDGDHTAFEAACFHSSVDSQWEQWEEPMLYYRNRKWIPKIEQLVKEGGAFIGVGAAHLVGHESVIILLRQKGYTVNHVRSATTAGMRASVSWKEASKRRY